MTNVHPCPNNHYSYILQEKVAVVTIVFLQQLATVMLSPEPTLVVLAPSRVPFLVPMLNASVLPLTIGQIKWVNLQKMPKHSLKPRNLV